MYPKKSRQTSVLLSTASLNFEWKVGTCTNDTCEWRWIRERIFMQWGKRGMVIVITHIQELGRDGMNGRGVDDL